MDTRHEQFAARMRGDTTNLPVILFDPLDTDTPTDKENNNDNDNDNDND